MNGNVSWGVCATIDAPAEEVLQFAAHYLAAGAQHIWVYLDAENPEAYDALDAHPACTVITCDDDYWRRIFRRRPGKHQLRQAMNATRTLARAGNVQWLVHVDVDEFVMSSSPLSEVLALLPDTISAARVAPLEVLAVRERTGGEVAFRHPAPPGPQQGKILRELYPTWGAHLTGGFLSHTAGKLFVRTNQSGATFGIYDVHQEGGGTPPEVTLNGPLLAHLHAPTWEHWLRHFDYRLAKGGYRAELAPENGINALLNRVIERAGTDGLRAFFDEVCADSPLMRERLRAQGLLAVFDLQLDAKVHHHFPDYKPLVATV